MTTGSFAQKSDTVKGHPADTIRVKVLDTFLVVEPPMILKKDTIVYNTSRWQTRAYAPLSDLMEKLPGIRLNDDGTITMNGQPVDRILVDGRPFFAGDPQFALQHLPAEIVRQVQVYPAADGHTGLTGFPGGASGNRNINLVLKNNRRKGDFGKLTAGAGMQGTYTGSMDLNHMKGSRQISVIGDAGNVDGWNAGKPGGTANTTGSGEYGISNRWNAGINFRDSRSDQADIYGSYMNSGQRTQHIQRIHSLNLFPGDSSTLLDQGTASLSQNNLQRLSGSVEIRLNAANSFIVRPDIVLQHTNTLSSQQAMQANALSKAPIYRSSGNDSSISDNKKFAGSLLFTHKGRQPFNILSMSLDVFSDRRGYNAYNFSQTTYSVPFPDSLVLHQHSTNSVSTFAITPSIVYKTRLSSHSTLEVQADYRYNRTGAMNGTFRYNDGTRQFDLPDQGQSNEFNNMYRRGRGMVNYRFLYNRLGIDLGAGIQSDQMQLDDLTRGKIVRTHYLNMLPAAAINLGLKNNKSLSISYSGRPGSLTVSQLQPVSVTTDSLFIQRGNPLLKYPFMHSFNLSYTSLHLSTQRFFTVMISGSLTVHAVQNAVTLLANGVRVTMPVNLNGTGNVFANFNYMIPVPRLLSNFSLGGNIRYSRDPGISNGVQKNTDMVNLSGEISWNLHSPGGIDLQIRTAPQYNLFHDPLHAGHVPAYLTESFFLAGSFTKKDWTGSLTGYYTINNTLPGAFRTVAPILSPAVSYRLFNRKAGEIRLSLVDMLNQRSGASRTLTPGAVTDTWSMTRGRYGLISFTYNLSRFK